MTLNKLVEICNSLKANGKRIVFTNGCFDLIHLGHIEYLKEAKALGDILIVGVNNDASVRKIKGINRPIKDEKSRLEILNSFKMVDYAMLFGEDTPLNLISTLNPDVLVKGGDYTVDQIVGSKLVLQNGGLVKSLNFKTGFSSSSIIEKILKQ